MLCRDLLESRIQERVLQANTTNLTELSQYHSNQSDRYASVTIITTTDSRIRVELAKYYRVQPGNSIEYTNPNYYV